MEAVSPDWTEAVHRALRGWYNSDPPGPPWSDLLIVSRHLAARPDLGWAVKQVVLEALDDLDEQAGGTDVARLLKWRFLDDDKAWTVANRLNITENMVYKRQAEAVRALAGAIWQREAAAREAQAARVLARLEVAEPPLLFGVADKRRDLLAALTAGDGPWLLALVGIGGIGKTSLADAAVRELAPGSRFVDVAWVSARQERFTVWGGLCDAPAHRPALERDALLAALIDQLAWPDLAQLPSAPRLAAVSARLKARPYLIVLDNLETAADYRALVPDLQALIHPTKCLLTCRHRLDEYPGVHSLSLDELSAADSLALLRHQARERGLTEVAHAPDDSLAPVYEVAGGNPLALKLLIGQLHTLSLSQVVDDLRLAQGRPADDLYRFIYWHSWRLLTDEARQLLITMPLLAEGGGGLEQLAALTGLPGERLTEALRQLVSLSLVIVRGSLAARRYGLHRLTETFLMNEVIKW